MATKSITRTIVIRDKKNCRALVRALEQSRSTDVKQTFSKTVYFEPSVEKLRNIFGVSTEK